MRITHKNVIGVFERFCKAVPAPRECHWFLEVSRPGDGHTRYGLYSVRDDLKGGHAQPIGDLHWLGASDAWYGLRAMAFTAEYMSDLARGLHARES